MRTLASGLLSLLCLSATAQES